MKKIFLSYPGSCARQANWVFSLKIVFHFRSKLSIYQYIYVLAVFKMYFNKKYIDHILKCDYNIDKYLNQRLPWACIRSPGSKLLSITTQLHCGGHLGGRVRLPDTILEVDHPMTIPSKFGSNWATGSRQDGFYVNFP